MKPTHITLFFVICVSSCSLFCNPSTNHKKPPKPSRSIVTSIKNLLHRTKKTIAAASECVVGAGGLLYGARLLPGSNTLPDGTPAHGTWHMLKAGDKACLGIYTAGTIIGVSLVLDGIEELNNQVDLTNRSMNMLKKIRTFLMSRKTKAKKTE
jgi:hypothetical protein